MKKLIFFAISIIVVSASFAQMPELDLGNIPDATFPCKLESSQTDEPRSIVFNTPNELSIYCSRKAQSNISIANGSFAAGVSMTALGGVIASVAKDNKFVVLGGVIMIGGAVTSIIGIESIIGHFKWEYRRKQVDLYLNTTGATLKF